MIKKRHSCTGCGRPIWWESIGPRHKLCLECREVAAEKAREGKRLCDDCGDPAWGRKMRCRPCHEDHTVEQRRRFSARHNAKIGRAAVALLKLAWRKGKGREVYLRAKARYRKKHESTEEGRLKRNARIRAMLAKRLAQQRAAGTIYRDAKYRVVVAGSPRAVIIQQVRA